MKKKNSGFTLIELLAVIAIITIISLIAIPNIVGLSDGIRKDNMLDDARKFIALAKYEVIRNYSIRISDVYEFKLYNFNTNGFVKDENTGEIKDPDGGVYDYEKSYIKYTKEPKASYCIVLFSSRRHIGSNEECILEGQLHNRDVVKDIEDNSNS